MERLDVREATNRYDVAFVSSIRTYGNLGPFRPANRADFKGVRLFDLLLRPDQVVCGSTVRVGDPDGNLYGNWGVIIGSGDIQQAFPYDATSYVVDGLAVSPYNWRNESLSIDTQVRHAIEYSNGHNEINVALGRRSISGIFFGNDSGGVDGIDMPSTEILDIIQPLRIPNYRLINGEFYLQNEGKAALNPTRPADIIQHQVDIPGYTKEYMKRQLQDRLVLPPRNSITAGWQTGKIQLDLPSPDFTSRMERHLSSDRIDHRYFGSMAIYSAKCETMFPFAAFDESTYTSLTSRILPGGLLSVIDDDLSHYLKTGTAPKYLGRI